MNNEDREIKYKRYLKIVNNEDRDKVYLLNLFSDVQVWKTVQLLSIDSVWKKAIFIFSSSAGNVLVSLF